MTWQIANKKVKGTNTCSHLGRTKIQLRTNSSELKYEKTINLRNYNPRKVLLLSSFLAQRFPFVPFCYKLRSKHVL